MFGIPVRCAPSLTACLLFILLATVPARAQEAGEKATATKTVPGQRVFVCGHSFHIFTAKYLPDLELGAGIEPASAGEQFLGNSRTLAHWDLPDRQNKAKAALRAGKVDVLTLSPHALLPDDGINKFTKLGLEKNRKLRVLVQSSWPAHDGTMNPKFKNELRDRTTVEQLREMRARHSEEWLKNLEEQVKSLNKEVGQECVFIVPASDAVFLLRERIAEKKAPGLRGQAELFTDPLGHASPTLMVLVTYCQYAAIYQNSPVGLPAPLAIAVAPKSGELNKMLQEIAWEAVSKYPLSGVVEK
jgi:hypothetical protein